MPDNTTSDGTTRALGDAPKPDRLIIRGYPKVVFFWPTAAVSALFALFDGFLWTSVNTYAPSHGLSLWWLITFTLNLVVFAFDFGRGNFLTLAALLGMAVFGLTAWDMASDAEVWGGVYGFFGDLGVTVNGPFFLCMAAIFSLFLALGFVSSRFDYWVLAPNELLHKHGLLGDVRGYSTLNMQVEKEIPDVFEFLLFGSGRLIFKPSGSHTHHSDVLVIDNVFRVNRAEKKVKEFLGVLKVDEK